MSNRNHRYLRIFSGIALVYFSVHNVMALTLTSANTIQGKRPTLFADGGEGSVPTIKDDVLYFKIKDGASGSKTFYGDSTAALANERFSATSKIDDFDVSYLQTGLWENYQDNDGDLLKQVNSDAFSKKLTNSMGKTLSSTDTLDPC